MPNFMEILAVEFVQFLATLTYFCGEFLFLVDVQKKAGVDISSARIHRHGLGSCRKPCCAKYIFSSSCTSEAFGSHWAEIFLVVCYVVFF